MLPEFPLPRRKYVPLPTLHFQPMPVLNYTPMRMPEYVPVTGMTLPGAQQLLTGHMEHMGLTVAQALLQRAAFEAFLAH